MEQWQFIEMSDGAWRWRHVNRLGASRESALDFRNRSDCVANAIYHGYVPAASPLNRGPGLGDAIAA